MTVIVGIDPGLTGALALVGKVGLLDMRDMPVMPRGGSGVVKRQVDSVALLETLRLWISTYDRNEIIVFIELINALAGNGKAGIFSQGLTSGLIEGVVCSLGLAHEFVSPSVWKRKFNLGKDKDAARALAQRYYPQASLARVKDHNRGEALLIARFGWELRG